MFRISLDLLNFFNSLFTDFILSVSLSFKVESPVNSKHIPNPKRVQFIG